MFEQIHQDYEVSSEGCVHHWEVPFARMTNAFPVETNPAELLSLLPGTQLTGTILTVDLVNSIAIVDFTCSMVYNHHVDNVRSVGVWGAINIGDPIYYDDTPALAAAGIFLSTAIVNAAAVANTLFGFAVPLSEVDVFPKGAALIHTVHNVGVMQIGAGH